MTKLVPVDVWTREFVKQDDGSRKAKWEKHHRRLINVDIISQIIPHSSNKDIHVLHLNDFGDSDPLYISTDDLRRIVLEVRQGEVDFEKWKIHE